MIQTNIPLHQIYLDILKAIKAFWQVEAEVKRSLKLRFKTQGIEAVTTQPPKGVPSKGTGSQREMIVKVICQQNSTL